VATSDAGARIAVGAAAQREILTPAIDGTDTGAARFGVGAVHIFRYENPDESWEPLSQVQAPDLGNCAAASGTGCTDRFGRSVSLTGDGRMLAVGAPRDDAEDGSRVPPQDTGAIYLY
jgi:hypothetical protein